MFIEKSKAAITSPKLLIEVHLSWKLSRKASRMNSKPMNSRKVIRKVRTKKDSSYHNKRKSPSNSSKTMMTLKSMRNSSKNKTRFRSNKRSLTLGRKNRNPRKLAIKLIKKRVMENINQIRKS